MNILLALNSFKGSCSSLNANRALQSGMNKIKSTDRIIVFPLCDGGDGSLEALKFHLKFKPKFVQTTDVLGRKIQGKYLWDAEKSTAYIELAYASGLARLGARTNDILKANSSGTGKLIKHALQYHPEKIVLMIGGSATNDAGIGIMDVLGVSFFDQHNKKLKAIPSNLIRIKSIALSQVELSKQTTLEIWTDVTNPFTGAEGAVAIYSKQKGATPQQQKQLEAGMLNFNKCIKRQFGIDLQKIKGSGAAGGVGGGLKGVLNAQIHHGTDELLKLFRFEEVVDLQDLILTGEGALDNQTKYGKLVDGVLKAAKSKNKPVIGVCGSLNLTSTELKKLGFKAAFSIVPGPVELEYAKQHGERLLKEFGTSLRSILDITYSSSSRSE